MQIEACLDLTLDYTLYRQDIVKFIKSETCDVENLYSKSAIVDHKVETSLLHSIDFNRLYYPGTRFSSVTLEQIQMVSSLLKAGADPMTPCIYRPSPLASIETRYIFWAHLLTLLHDLSRETRICGSAHIEKNIEDSRISEPDPRVTLGQLWNVTKLLLNSGAQLNYVRQAPHYQLDLGAELQLVHHNDAMSILEESFSAFPDFQPLYLVAAALGIRPWSGSLHINYLNSLSHGTYEVVDIDLQDKDCQLLWPLLEQYKRSGNSSSLEQLSSAAKAVCKRLEPDISLH